MSLLRFMILTGLGAVLSWLAWSTVIVRLDPQAGGVVAHGLFYTSLFLALLGTFTVIGFYARYFFEREEVPYRQASIAARQAFLVSLAAIVCLSMQAHRWLNPWTGLLTFVVVVGIEAFFIAGQSRRRVSSES